MKPIFASLAILGALTAAAIAFPATTAATVMAPRPVMDIAAVSHRETAVFAGGCFWGVEGVYSHVKGVISATSGYSGGSAATATYDQSSTGRTGHAESVRVVFDPTVVSYGQLLRIYFSVVADPTLKDAQGPDHGTQYRSALFPLSPAQARVARAYLGQAKSRPNLTISTDSHATRVLFDGTRAVGVTYRQKGADISVAARREVLLCAGAIQSPQLLQLSGVGPADLLRRYGIATVVESPGVGDNLQDHLQVRLIYKCSQPVTTNDDLRTLWGRMRIGMQWLFARRGPLAIGIQLGGLFARALPDAKTPDVQFHFGTISADVVAGKPHDFSGFTVSVCQLRPTSRGTVRIKSADPLTAPAISANYLATQYDCDVMVAATQLTRRLMRTEAMKHFIAEEYKPGQRMQTEEDILEFVRSDGVTIFHPVGTCSMGPGARDVVDERLRVYGTTGLRVVDASIMPLLVSGNTNAGAIMIGEKAADMIRADEKLDALRRAQRPVSAQTHLQRMAGSVPA